MAKKTNPKAKDYLALVKRLYRIKGIRPLSKALVEASKLWGKKFKI